MTQETYDYSLTKEGNTSSEIIEEVYRYLLVRNYLITNTLEELVTDINRKDIYDKCVQDVSYLMQRENMILVLPGIFEKVDRMIKDYRFDYSDKNNIDDVNFIVARLNEYKQKQKDEVKLAKDSINFFLEEFRDRDLSLYYANHKEKIVEMIAEDFNIFSSFASGREDGPLEVHIDYFASTVNLLLTRFNEFFHETEITPYLIEILKDAKSAKDMPFISKCYVSRTLNRLKKMEKAKQKIKRLEEN